MDILIIALIVIVVIFFLSRRSNKTIISNQEKKLIQICFGDKEKAERLINYELKRHPKLSRKEAADDAVKSIGRDNR
ncbi:hypothetical protein QUF74_02035 [Candidatus Halobeggiatoa sp. HSG11]|nr:hypothetical protein [Candidatus Halobeggiatoa sp. HSG11]